MISSRQNRFVKAIRNLRRSKGDLALLEGDHLVSEALVSRLAFSWVLMTPEFHGTPRGIALAGRLPETLTHEVSAEVLDSVADADSPRGVVAAVTLARTGVRGLPLRAGGSYLFLDRIQDPGNLGAIARVAEAAGATGLALSAGTVHPNHPRALRASAGSLLRLPVAVESRIEQLLEHLEPLRPQLAALDSRGSQDLYGADLSGTLLLALGSEGTGLSPGVMALASTRLAISIAPPVESLNVAVAAAIALFERRRRLSGGS